jgi:hypothetical protein
MTGDEKIKGIEKSWSKTSTIYNRTLTEAQRDIWALLSEREKLEEGIKKVLKWRNLDGDGISDPLRKELYGLIEKEK